MDPVSWFKSEVLLKRVFLAQLWASLCQPVFLWAFLLVIHFNPIHPLIWFRSGLACWFWPSSWLFCAGLLLCLLGLVALHASNYSVVPHFFPTRCALLRRLLAPDTLMALVSYVFLGGLIMRFYLGIGGGDHASLSMSCHDSDGLCINEKHFFLVLSGCFMGLSGFIKDYIFNGHYIQFPLIQQEKYLQFRSALWPLAQQSGLDTLFRLRWFYLLYFWKGGVARDYLRHLVGLQMPDVHLDTFSGLADFHLLLLSWLWASFLLFNFNILKVLFQLFITEHIIFPVEVPFEAPQGLQLQPALAAPPKSLLRHLAFLDLVIFSRENPYRRKEVFVLSQPGGHPRNWNHIRDHCLMVIKVFTCELNGVSRRDPRLFLPAALPAVTSRVQGVTPKEMELKDGRMQPRDMINVPKRMAPPLLPALRPFLRNKLDQLWTALKQKPGFFYLFGELPDAKASALFGRSEIVIWAVQALSHLVAASFKDDKYGVVQKDLSQILTQILSLHLSLENHQRHKPSAPTGAFPSRERDKPIHVQLKQALMSTVKSSLYRVAITFGHHLGEVSLSSEHSQIMCQFINFKEG